MKKDLKELIQIAIENKKIPIRLIQNLGYQA